MSNQNSKTLDRFNNPDQLKQVLAQNYYKQFVNYLGDDVKARKFLSSVMASAQRVPELMECTPISVINSFLTVAELGLMPSHVAGEAYVLPYENKSRGVKEAQFQLGYQGLVTLLYRAGVRAITAEIVYEKDSFEYLSGEVTHRPDVFADDRGEPIGAYVIITLPSGDKVAKVMKKKDILAHGQKFSKSYGSKFSPWDPKNDPELWMWKKTVLKQAQKLVPKNETVNRAIAEDNKDSVIEDRLKEAEVDSESIKMGNLLKEKNHEKNTKQKESETEGEAAEDPQDVIR